MTLAQDQLELLNKNKDISIELLRAYLGIGLLLKGIHFMLDMDQAFYFLQQGKLTLFPFLIVHYMILAHICGGAFMAIGLLTRAAALAQIPILIGAVFFMHAPQGFFTAEQTLEFSTLVLFMLCVFAVYGSGRLSVDYFLEKRSKKISGSQSSSDVV